jgi:hypothetical protein
MASRLMTANMGSALDEGLTMDNVDENYKMSDDPEVQFRDRQLKQALSAAPVRGSMRGGRRMSQSDVVASMKKQQEAVKNLKHNGKRVVKELEKNVKNLNKNRGKCQEIIDTDEVEINKLNAMLAEIKVKKAVVQKAHDERIVQRDALRIAMKNLENGMTNLVSRVFTAKDRHQKTEHKQVKIFSEANNTAERGYHLARTSLKPRDLLPLSLRRSNGKPKFPAQLSRSSPGLLQMPGSPISGGSASTAWSPMSTGGISTPKVTSPSAPMQSLNPLAPLH